MDFMTREESVARFLECESGAFFNSLEHKFNQPKLHALQLN